MQLVIFTPLSVLSVGLFIVFAVLSLIVLFRSDFGKVYRTSLEGSLENTRMSGMLKSLGVNTVDYVDGHGIIDAHKHVNACTACIRAVVCERTVACGGLDVQTIDFCDNRDGIARVLM